MKKSVAITTVLALHIAVISMLLIQAGCSSEPAEPKVVQATSSTSSVSEIKPEDVNDGMKDANGKEELIQAPEGSPALRSDPTRPVANISDEKEPETLVEKEETVAPKTAETTPVTPKSDSKTYEVQKGDSLGKIARKFKVSVAQLADLNGIPRTSALKIGQKLSIPETAAVQPIEAKSPEVKAESSSAETEIYIVKRGDSLGKIARKYRTTVKQLMAINNLKNHNIRIGQKLTVAKNSAQATTVAEAAKASNTVAEGEVSYTIKSGDTLGGIAIKYGTTVKAISERNNISDPRKIRVGQVIIVKGKVEAKKEAPKATETKTTTPVVAPAPATTAPAAPAQPAAPAISVQADAKVESSAPAPVTVQPAQVVPTAQPSPAAENLPVTEL